MANNPDENWRHLPPVTPDRAEAARLEAQELETLSRAPRGKRYGVYLKKPGPGWMQSATTPGGGSAIASLFLGTDLPRGTKALLWNTGMLTAVLLAAASSLYYLVLIFDPPW